ncbi:MAG: RadC family protein [Eubacterium sp.]
MADLQRQGHRKRMRNAYLKGAYESLPDHNLLELFLSLVIPQKDVKPVAYALMNKFKTVEGVLNASVQDLMSVDGVGESSAIAIKLVSDLNKRALISRNKNVVRLNTLSKADEYCWNLLSQEKVERVIMITLKPDKTVINVHTLDMGTVNSSFVNVRKLVETALDDSASAVIISHNHPDGKNEPSSWDLDLTVELKAVLRKVNIVLLEHIVVGNSVCNVMREHPSFSKENLKALL